jgi:hypothetical protein
MANQMIQKTSAAGGLGVFGSEITGLKWADRIKPSSAVLLHDNAILNC